VGDGWDRRPGRPGPLWAGRRSSPPWSFVAVVLLVLQLVGSTAAARHQPSARPLDALGYLLLVLGPLTWLLLRRRPVVVAAGAVGAAATYLGLGYASGPVVASAGLSLIAAVARGHRIGAWVTGAVGYGALLGLGALSGHAVSGPRAIGYAAWLVVVLLVGEGPRYRAEQFAAARRARAAETQAAASAERLAIARDLHDTIGHSLSMIAVQAGVALHLLDDHPEQARPALTAIRTASKEALEEVRSTLAVLRQDGTAPPAHIGLARVGDLVEAVRLGGLDVRLQIDPLSLRDFRLPPAVDSAAYRVVQEALTNVTRHASATHAQVTLRREERGLEVVVVDDGVGATDSHEGGGLRGMRERTSALGATMDVGSEPGGGFRVAVRFPLDNGADRTEGPA
jgi:signal transduction histidine kinase